MTNATFNLVNIFLKKVLQSKLQLCDLLSVKVVEVSAKQQEHDKYWLKKKILLQYLRLDLAKKAFFFFFSKCLKEDIC